MRRHRAARKRKRAKQASAAVESAYAAHIIPARVEIEFRMTSTRRGDLDNLAKPVLDTLFRQSRRSKHPVACLFECDDFSGTGAPAH